MKPQAIWLYGLSGAGKSTLSNALTQHMLSRGIAVKQLDGDDLRQGLNSNLGFSHQDRLENIRRSAEVAKLFVKSGFVTLCSFITPTQATRQVMQQVLTDCKLTQIYVKASIDTCQKRDPKGFYGKVNRGEIKNFTGIDSLFEAPHDSDIIADTDLMGIEEATKYILNALETSTTNNINIGQQS